MFLIILSALRLLLQDWTYRVSQVAIPFPRAFNTMGASMVNHLRHFILFFALTHEYTISEVGVHPAGISAWLFFTSPVMDSLHWSWKQKFQFFWDSSPTSSSGFISSRLLSKLSVCLSWDLYWFCLVCLCI